MSLRIIRRTTSLYIVVDFIDGKRGAVTLGATFHVTAYNWPICALHYRTDRQGD